MATNHNVNIHIEAVDDASKTISNVAKELESLGKLSGLKGLSNISSTIGNITKVFSSIKGKAGIAVAGIATVVTGFSKLYNASKQSFIDGLSKIWGVCQTVFSGLTSLASGFLGLVQQVTGADLSFTGLAQSALDYEQQMKRVVTIVGANSTEMGQLDSLAQKLGATTQFTAGQVAEAMEQMAQNGMKVNEILASTDNVLDLAIVGNIELADSAGLVSNALNAFGYDASEAERVTNTFTRTALNSGANVEQFGQTLKYAGATAGALGIDIEQVGAVAGVMGDNFVKGSSAGTALRTIMANMAKPTNAMTKCIEKYNLEGARQKILNGDLVGGLEEMSDKLNGLGQEEKLFVATTLAGKYGLAGFLAVINSGTPKIEEMYEAIKNGADASKVAKKYMDTLTGQLLIFVSELQGCAIKIYQGLEVPLKNAMKTINTFIQTLMDGNIAGAFEYLANESKKWGEALSQGLQDAINSIGEFINGGSLDSILEIGTNIVQGICDGIHKAYQSGSLTEAITGFIEKICNFITTNAPAIQQAGADIIDAIKQGIENNKGNIADAMESICGVIETWVGGSAQLEATMGQFARIMIDSFVEQTKLKAQAKASEFWEAIKSMFSPSNMPDFSEGGTGLLTWIDGCIDWSIDKINQGGEKSGQAYGEGVQKGADGTPLKLNPENFQQSYEEYGNYGLTGGQNFGTSTAQGIENTKSEIIAKGSEVGTGTAQAIQDGLESMNTEQLTELKNAIDEVGQVTTTTASEMKTAFTGIADSARTNFMNFTNIVRNQMVNASNIIRNQAVNWSNILRNQCINMGNSCRTAFVNIANIARNQFVNVANIVRNQMLNCSNIIRNQAVNWSNIIRNQCQNARNALTSSFLSMASVARTQMVNISNIIRNQAVAWANIIRNQAQNARNALTSSFMSMASVVRNQMANCLSIVRSYMAQIKSAVSQQMTMNFKVNKTITTTNITKNVTEGLRATMGGISRNTMSIGQPAVMSATGVKIGNSNERPNNESSYMFSIPLYIDGREVARATATYNQEQLNKLEKRSKRKRGEN